MQDFSTLSQYEADWAAKFNCDLLSMRSDPLNAAHLVRTGLDIQSRLYLGRVVDVMAYCHCYKVVLENGRSAIPCALTTATSLYGIGAKQINTLLPGTPVLVMRHPQLSYGLILCVLPSVIVIPVGGSGSFGTRFANGRPALALAAYRLPRYCGGMNPPPSVDDVELSARSSAAAWALWRRSRSASVWRRRSPSRCCAGR
jgi:hypothetical protein